MTAGYADFLARKRAPAPADGFRPDVVSGWLYPFQRELVVRALERGRSAVFADCGLGKTPVQLEWARQVRDRTGGDVLILAPLAVAAQTTREAAKFGVDVRHVREAADVAAGISITNYERLPRFATRPWAGVVLDESSILKAFDGKTRQALVDFARPIPFRLCATATPSPNDHVEFGGHADFLDVLSAKQMLAMFFVNDGINASSWRLKGHADGPFWRWLASWASALRRPSDVGHPDDGFALPPLNVELVTVDADSVSGDRRLFPVPVSTLQERRQARSESIPQRVTVATDLVNGGGEPWVVWCDLNAESGALARAIPDAVEVRGSDTPEAKEQRLEAFSRGDARVIVTKPSIGGFGLNWQHCPNVLFVGLSDSYESYYQAIRRCWRFGQTRPVRVVVCASRREQTVLENIARKERQADEMFERLVRAQRSEAA